jgi:RNA polymerase sigma-70 factor, ECF subfamily
MKRAAAIAVQTDSANSKTLLTTSAELTDEQIVHRVLAGETALFEILMRRHNQRLYRAARAILRDDTESEDVMQEAYVRAYQHLGQFAGKAKFSTWLTRIAVNEALGRAARRTRMAQLDSDPEFSGRSGGEIMRTLRSEGPNPEEQVSGSELQALLQEAILNLPESYRTVLMLRDVEEMSTAEAAECLSISEENLKVRLHRARSLLRKQLYARTGASLTSAFSFHAVRCDRVVKAVFERIAQLPAAQDIVV